MILFKQRKPRRFSHRLIYSDERKRHLQEIEERARQRLGLVPPKQFVPEDLRGAFLRSTRHAAGKRRKNAAGKQAPSGGLLALIVLVLLLLMFYLMGGVMPFVF